MTNQYLIIISLILAFFAANIPWISDKFLIVCPMKMKTGWIRWLEWLICYFVFLGFFFGLEFKLMGGLSQQDWEFYVVTICLFIVFAIPGFIYYVDLKKILKSAR